MTHIILLEDDNSCREELAGFLSEIGYVVDKASNIEEFDNVFLSSRHVVALINLGLPDGDGVNLITTLRARGEQLGIIIITARNGPANKVTGLNAGADHYITKPFDPEELAATIISLVRRMEGGGISQRWRLDSLRRQLIPPGKPAIDLTAKGYIVLKTIADGGGLSVSRRQIVAALGEDYLQYDQRRLDTQLHQLRKTVAEASGMELPIRTARGCGYQITVKIELR